jgi:hypothetical protein
MEEYNAKRIRELMQFCVKGLSKHMAADDIVNIGNSMAYELANYDEYNAQATEILESKDHPLTIAGMAHDEIEQFISEGSDALAISKIPDLAAAIRDIALEKLAVSFACRVIDIIDDDDSDGGIGMVSVFVDMFEMTFGSASLVETDFDDEMKQLIEIASAGFDVDFIGADIESPPMSLDRGEVRTVKSEDYISSMTGEDMTIAKTILSRLNLKSEDLDKMLEMAGECDESGSPKYSTTELINKAQEIIGEYE